MAQMDYFRRPQIAGKTIQRVEFGTIRGSIRRDDPDGISAVPYFSAAVVAQTLIISIDGAAPVTVILTGIDLTTVLSDINTAIAGTGQAFDSDGTIGLQTLTGGNAGSIEVTGGTAAEALGFDVGAGTIRSVGGDIPSTPEGRTENWFGASFPNRGENLTSEAITRSLARISANTDVLYSDIARTDVVLKSVSSVTVDNVLLTVDASTRIFTGFGILSAASVSTDLAPYFHLIDDATGYLAQSKVVAVVRGAVVGLPPYADATTWTGGGAIGNVLGVNLVKYAAQAITSIKNGRVLYCAGATWTDAQVGDWVEITGATNTDEFDNNGMKWIIEEVIDTNAIAVRPMSKSELAQAVILLNDEQPTLELNGELAALQVYGNAVIYTGSYCSQVNVIVDPPIPDGATYTLWASQPASLRSSTLYDAQKSHSNLYKDLHNPWAAEENWTKSGLDASLGGGDCLISAGRIIWFGRVYLLPGATFPVGDFTDNATNYVYWDDANALYGISTLTTPWANILHPTDTSNNGHLVAIVVVAGGVITNVYPATRLRAEKSIPVTVGLGGQFSSLSSAVAWASLITSNAAETVSATGTFPHFEFIIVSDLTVADIVEFGTMPAATLRGVHSKITLTMTDRYFSTAGKYLEIKDLTISTTNPNYFVRVLGAAATEKVILSNIHHTTGTIDSVIITTGTGVLNDARISDCEFIVKVNVVRGTGSGARGVDSIRLTTSKFTYSAGSPPHIIDHGTPGDPWDGDLLVVQDCDFLGAWGGISASGDLNPLFVYEFGSHPTTPSQIVIQNVRMSLGNYVAADNTKLISAILANTLIDNLYMTAGKIPCAVHAGDLTTVRNSTFLVNPSGSGIYGVMAGVIDNCYISHEDTDADPIGGEGVRPLLAITNSTVIGPFQYHIRPSGTAVKVTGNTITSALGALFAENLDSAIYLSGSADTIISGNSITLVTNIAGTGLSYGVRLTGTCSYAHISDNSFIFAEGGTALGSTSGTHTHINFSNNSVLGTSDTAQGIDISRLTKATISGNVVRMIGAPSTALRAGTITADARISGNFLEAGVSYTSTGTGLQIITSNVFVGPANTMYGTIQDNTFNSTLQLGGGVITGNRIVGEVTLTATVPQFRFVDNYVTAGLDALTTPVTFTDLLVVIARNYIGGLLQLQTASNMYGLHVSGNQIVSDASFIYTGHLFLNENFIQGGTTILAGTDGNGYAYINNNYLDVGGGISLVATAKRLQVTGNYCSAQVTLIDGSSAAVSKDSFAEVSENYFAGALSTSSKYVTINDNNIRYTVYHSYAVGSGATDGSHYILENNRISIDGTITANDVSALVPYNYIVRVKNNTIEGANLVISLAGEYLDFEDNSVIPVTGPTLTFKGYYIKFNKNVVKTVTNSLATIQATLILLSLNLADTSTVHADGNEIIGGVTITHDATITNMGQMWVTNNSILNKAASAALICGEAIGNGADTGGSVIQGNYIFQDNSNLTNAAYSAIVLNASQGTSSKFIIANNVLRAVAPTYDGGAIAFTTGLISSPALSAISRTVISSNEMIKPATIAGPPIRTYNYVYLVGAWDTLMVGNLLASGNPSAVGGVGVHQGATAYTAGAGATFVVAE